MFDDPISSLDHKWREAVARRLVEEAKERQVLVFTHDLAFLLFLVEQCESAKIDPFHSHLLRTYETTGEAQVGPPWLAAKVKDRVSHLKQRIQLAEKVYTEMGATEYETFACDIYGRLRETWERAVEEVLLNDCIRRFRRSIETNRLSKVADIKNEDIDRINAAMTKCSKFIRGHDKSVVINESIPGPAQLKIDVENLETWVSEVCKRRN